MATVVKDFKVKAGLIVEGTTAKVNNFDILTKSSADQSFIVSLIGGAATSANTPDTVVLRDANGDFNAGTISAETGFSGSLTGNVTGDVIGNLSGDVTGNVTGDVLGNLTGDVTGDVIGNLSGDVTGNVTGDVLGNLTGNVTGDVTGNAGTATALETARTIAGQSFDGTANISIATTDLTDVTATAAEVNILDGATITTAELNHLDGVTSGVQAQLNTKAPLESPALTGTPTAPTADQSVNNTQVATTSYVRSAVSAVVDGAPELLDTLNELAAAIGNDENFAATISEDIGKKLAKTGGTMTGDITLAGAPTADLHAATKKYVDDEITSASTAATTAVSDHNALTTGVHGVTGNVVGTTDTQTLTNKAIDGSSNTVSNIANASLVNDSVTVNGSTVALGGSATLDTDAIGEGSANQYFTDERAQDAVAAAIAAGTHENIVITYDANANSISFVAENGVEDSTTDDLDEGTINLYFTDARAVSALEAVVPNFTEVDLNAVATQVAATSTVETASQAVAYTFDGAVYRSAKFLVKVAYGTHTEVSEVLLTLDTSDNIAITEYAVVGTNGSASTISAGMDNTDVQLLVTTTNNNSTITVMGTLLK